jgi:hypothetical protein
MKYRKNEQPNDSCTSFCLVDKGFAVFGTNYDHGKVHEGMIFTNKRGVKKTYWDTEVNNPHAEWTSKHAAFQSIS